MHDMGSPLVYIDDTEASLQVPLAPSCSIEMGMQRVNVSRRCQVIELLHSISRFLSSYQVSCFSLPALFM